MIEKPRVAVSDLSTYVQAEIDRVPTVEDGYSECVVAMQNAALAAVEAVARELGVTGFQYSIAALKIIGAMRDMEGPFMIVDPEQALYPQYDLPKKVQDFLTSESTKTWLAEEAQKKLDFYAKGISGPHPGVKAHWEKLVAEKP